MAESFEHRYGLGISAGGGGGDWFDQTLRDVTGVSGFWEVRVYAGLNQPIGLEVAYVGRASSLHPFIGPEINNTDLLGNGVEAAARLNIYHDRPFQPYGFVGVGWMHFSTTGDNDINLADFGMNGTDDIVTIPIGAGLAWRSPWFGLLLDARFTFRPSVNEGLVATEVITVNGVPLVPVGFADMDSWEASGRIGYEF